MIKQIDSLSYVQKKAIKLTFTSEAKQNDTQHKLTSEKSPEKKNTDPFLQLHTYHGSLAMQC